MYYAHFILNKKGPLAKIWLAAHWDKKLTKAQIYETNIESTIEAILEPQMKLALRTSGHLLLGICRIYSRKVKYLLADCNEAFVKIKLAFRPGLIDLPKEKQQAAAEAITLPEKFPEFLVNFPEINMDMDMELGLGPKSMGSLATQMARVEDITLKEDFGSTAMVTMQDDDFGDMGMGAASFGMDTFMFSDVERGRHMADSMIHDGIGVGDGLDQMEVDKSAHVNDKSELHKSNLRELSAMEVGELESNLENRTTERGPEDTIMQDMPEIDNNDMDITGKPPVVPTLFDEQPTVNLDEVAQENRPLQEDEAGKTTTGGAVEKQIRARRKRKVVIDEIKEIDSATMKAQLSDTTSILGTLELAPPTRKLMHLKEIGGVDKLFAMTARPIHNKLIAKLYTRNMVTKSLTDITNSLKEKARGDDHHTSKVLPLADSYLEVNDVSRGGYLEAGKDATNREDDFDNFGPASVYNPNLDDMLEKVHAEVTPSKPKPSASDSDSDSDEGDENKSTKNKTPHKKRSYRKSMNTTLTTSQRDQTIKDELDEEGAGDGTSQDPSKNLTKRAKTMVSLLNRSFNKQDNVGFFEITKRNGKKSVVQKFYSLLVLKKYEIIEVTQAETFGDIIISKGDKFESFAPS